MDEILPRRTENRMPAYQVMEAGGPKAPAAQLPWQERLRIATVEGLDRYERFRRRASRVFHKVDHAVAGKRLLPPLSFLLAAGVLGAWLTVSTVYTPAYVVTVDGMDIGTVSDPAVFEAAEARVEERASEILGYDYHLSHTVTYDKALIERGTFSTVSGFETFLFNGIEAVQKSYTLMVNGAFIGAAVDEAGLTAMLDTIKAPYITENTVSADFVEAVSIGREYTPSDVMQDAESMMDVLTSNTTGETTYEVKKGDTFMQIAYDNDMGMEDLEDLNPDIDIEMLMIGQILNVKEVVPFLSVKTVDNVTYEQAIASPVEEVNDDSMYQGESKVLDPGTEGLARINANVTYVNGYERGRDLLDSVTLTEPTAKVIAVGTKVRPSWLPNGNFIWPAYGSITSSFGYRYIFGSYSYHSGIDIAVPYGSSVKAADGGTVIWSGTGTGSNWSYGNYIIIDHGNGKHTYYAHNSSLLVSAGDHVYQGQVIAKAGSTGRSTGSHCHFQVKINGTTVNPMSYLP